MSRLPCGNPTFCHLPDWQIRYTKIDAMTKYPNRIRETRQRLGLSLDAAAAKAGLDASTLSRLETGRRATSEQYMIKIAKAFGVRVSDLSGESAYDLPEINNANANGPETREPMFLIRGGYVTINVTVDFEGFKRLREQLNKLQEVVELLTPSSANH
jgi:transcriptional regulator with XRE-family HTH domain